MDRATRSFIVASLVYLAAGAVLGLLMVWAPDSYAGLLFTHVHLLLGGFMAMMVFGVGYFILPRFAATGLRWPSLVGVHFWLANLSLLAMVVARPVALESGSDAWGTAFLLAAAVQVFSALLFTVNLGWTLVAPQPAAGPKPEAVAAPAPAAAGASAGPTRLPTMSRPDPVPEALGPDSPVGSWVDGKEGALELLVQAGLRPLQDPQHLEMVRKAGIPLSHACTKHGIPLASIVGRLRSLPDRNAVAPGSALTPDDVIGEMVKRYPPTREVLRARFGEGCFTCPGFETETLAQGAMMHGVDVNELVAELNAVVAAGD